MRISDWSSDVCSSDLSADDSDPLDLHAFTPAPRAGGASGSSGQRARAATSASPINPRPKRSALDRKSVVTGTSVSVRVDLGGSSIIKQKKQRRTDIKHT